MKTRLLCLLPALLLAISTFGQNLIYLPWEFAGGPPCPVRDITLQAGTLYAATDCGLYKRPENGGNWEQQPGTPNLAVLFVQANASAIVAVFQGGVHGWTNGHSTLYIFNSLDGGATFVRRYSHDYNFWTVTSNPHPMNRTDYTYLYALGDSSFALTVHACDYGCRYAQLVSTNDGQDWTYKKLPSDITFTTSKRHPYAVQGDSLAVFHFDSLHLVATADFQRLAAVRISPPLTGQAAGLTWVQDRITVTFQDGRYAYTDDSGQDWTADSLPLSGIHDFFQHENYYYWCTSTGFYRSATVGPVQLETLYTRPGPLGAVRSALRGASGWYLLANGVLLLLPDSAGDAVPVSTDGLAAAKGQLSCLPGRLMFLNTDGLWWQSPDGEDWTVYENETAYSRHFRHFYAGDTFSLAFATPPGLPASIYRSVDSGVSWTFSPSSVFPNLYTSTAQLENRHDGRVYYGQRFTADGGLSWQLVNAYAPTAALGDTLLTIPGQSGGRISFDHGQNWQDLVVPGPATSYTFHLADRTLFALPYYADMAFRSVDFGLTWEAIGMGGLGGQVESRRVGQTTWLYGRDKLGFIADPGEDFFGVGNTPFSGTFSSYPSVYPHPVFGSLVQKDSTVYAAYNGGVWRSSACYAQHPFPTPLRDTTICQGNAVLFDGDTLRTTGTYIRKIPGLTTVCDSLDVLRLQVNLIITSWNKRICAGDTLLWNGLPYTGYGSFTQQFSTPTNCDSTVTLHLAPYYTNAWANAPLCANDTLLLNGQAITTPGQYTFQLTSVHGCDSMLMLNVYEAQDTFNFSPTICAGAGYSLFGHTYTQTGEYWFTRIVPTNPCPSIYHILLTVQPDEVLQIDTSVTVGTVLYGTAVYSDTTFTVVISGASSCDKILTITAHTTVDLSDPDVQQPVQVFPNPFRDQLIIRWTGSETAQLRLYDSQGKCLLESRLSGPGAVLQTAALPPGLYRAEILLGGRCYARKVVKMP